MTVDKTALSSAIAEALQETKGWPVKGWPMTFGPRNVAVNNLEEAEALPRTFNNRMEAVSYWNRIKSSSQESETWGQRAEKALSGGDIADARDSIYFAMVVEKGFRGEAPTWSKVWEVAKPS